MRAWVYLLLTGVLACGGGDDGGADDGNEPAAQGGLGEDCYPTGTCDDGLSCESGECVGADDDPGAGGSNDGTGGDDDPGLGGDGGANSTGGTTSSGGGTATGGTGGTMEEPEPEPLCRTVSVTNPVAGEKVNAALCFGLAYEDAYSCTFYPVDNMTFCEGLQTGYVVVWMSDQYGDVYDLSDDSFIGQIAQGATGAFVIDYSASGAVGQCTVVGDVATLCITATP